MMSCCRAFDSSSRTRPTCSEVSRMSSIFSFVKLSISFRNRASSSCSRSFLNTRWTGTLSPVGPPPSLRATAPVSSCFRSTPPLSCRVVSSLSFPVASSPSVARRCVSSPSETRALVDVGRTSDTSALVDVGRTSGTSALVDVGRTPSVAKLSVAAPADSAT